jgi:drug/metabolite transporter (DMT)-like permease
LKKWAYLLVAAGATLWGTISVFVEGLYDYGFTPIQVVAVRVMTAAAILCVYLAVRNPSLLKIKFADGKYFIGTGIFSIVFFNWCLFTAMRETSVSVAWILLYTGPAFVTILSRFVLKEPFTKRKVTALVMTFVGCAFVVGFLPAMNGSISTFGLLVGLGSGFGYALYSIFSKFAEKYAPITITTYTFIFASLAMLPTTGLWNHLSLFLNRQVLLYSLSLGFLPTALAYVLYTTGLKYVESSRASITATVEPIVATFIGIFLFGESLNTWQITGVFFVLAAVILVQEKRKRTGNVRTV